MCFGRKIPRGFIARVWCSDETKDVAGSAGCKRLAERAMAMERGPGVRGTRGGYKMEFKKIRSI